MLYSERSGVCEFLKAKYMHVTLFVVADVDQALFQFWTWPEEGLTTPDNLTCLAKFETTGESRIRRREIQRDTEQKSMSNKRECGQNETGNFWREQTPND